MEFKTSEPCFFVSSIFKLLINVVRSVTSPNLSGASGFQSAWVFKNNNHEFSEDGDIILISIFYLRPLQYNSQNMTMLRKYLI
jgi:hypothetical protein